MTWAVSPFVWFGGKQRLARRIADLLPEHLVYVEPFGGAASVLLTKVPARLDVYNDRDELLVNFFRVLRDQPEELERRLRLTPFSRSEFDRSVRAWRDGFRDVADQVELARLFWVRIEQAFAGTPMTVGWAGEFRGRRRGSRAKTSWTKLDRLERCVARLRTVQIENLDWRDCLDRYDGPDCVFYLDPPYEPSTRKPNRQAGGRAYWHDLTPADHEELIDRVQLLEGSVLLSGYDHPVYRVLEPAFERFEFKALSAAANAVGAVDARRTEILWRRVSHFGSLLSDPHIEACRWCGGSGFTSPPETYRDGEDNRVVCADCRGDGQERRDGYAALDLSGIDWLIVGGESGPHARPMDPEWARELRDACVTWPDGAPFGERTGPAFFFKQVGGRTPKTGGRLRDGREWNEMPTARAEVIV